MVTFPLGPTSQGLFSVQYSPFSLPVSLTATSNPVEVSMTGEPEVPPMVWLSGV
jgi:hypothetical protein